MIIIKADLINDKSSPEKLRTASTVSGSGNTPEREKSVLLEIIGAYIRDFKTKQVYVV